MPLSTTWMHIRRADVQLHTFLTWTVDRVEWPTSRPGHFTPGKEPQYPLGGPVWTLWRREKSLCPILGFHTSIVQLVVYLLYRICSPGFRNAVAKSSLFFVLYLLPWNVVSFFICLSIQIELFTCSKFNYKTLKLNYVVRQTDSSTYK